MRRSSNRAVAMLLAASIALVSACGSSSKRGEASNPAAAKSPIKLGILADITGTFAIPGAATHIATDLALEQINVAGGINGHPLQATYVDPRGDPAEAIQLAAQLVQQDHVDVLVGGANSAECLAVEKLAPKLGVVYVTTNGCAAEEVTSQSCNKYTFRMFSVGRQLTDPLAGYLVKTYGKRWVILYPDYALGQSQLQAYQASLEKAGGDITIKIPVPLGASNDTPYVTKVPTDGSVDGVIATFSAADQSRLISTLQQFGINKMLPIVGAGTKDLFGGVYPDALNGAIGAQVELSAPPADNPDDQAFERAYRDQAGKEGGLAGALGGPSNAVAGQTGYPAYVALTALKVAMTAAKFTGKADTEKLIHALEDLKAQQGPDFPAGPAIMSKTDHQIRETVYVYKIDGQKENVLQRVAPEQVPDIGNCHV